MIQPLLPFTHLNIPERHLLWLKQANAGAYPDKKWWFYPFKTRLLRARGVTDGLDLQTIVHKCWCGDGIWRGKDYDVPERFHDVCHKCNGTGIYQTRHVVLIRWLINGHLFHEPSELIRYHSGMEFKERYDGLIKHADIPEVTARRAFERLLLRYEPETFYRLWMSRWRDWKEIKMAAWRFRIRKVKILISLEKDSDVPF